MVKMNNKMITLCTLAIGSIYVTGFTMTEPTHAAAGTPVQQKVEATIPKQSSSQKTPTAASSNVQTQTGNQPTAKPVSGAVSANQNNTSTTKKTTTNTHTQSQSKASSSKQATNSKQTSSSKQATNSKQTSSSKQATSSKQTSSSKQASATKPTVSTTKPQTAPKKTSPTPTNKVYKDGTFTGVGSAWNGTVQVAVTTKQDRITSVQITNCTTSYSESNIAPLPQEVVAKQSANIALVSGATVSSEDFQQAVQQALGKAKL